MPSPVGHVWRRIPLPHCRARHRRWVLVAVRLEAWWGGVGGDRIQGRTHRPIARVWDRAWLMRSHRRAISPSIRRTRWGAIPRVIRG